MDAEQDFRHVSSIRLWHSLAVFADGLSADRFQHVYRNVLAISQHHVHPDFHLIALLRFAVAFPDDIFRSAFHDLLSAYLVGVSQDSAPDYAPYIAILCPKIRLAAIPGIAPISQSQESSSPLSGMGHTGIACANPISMEPRLGIQEMAEPTSISVKSAFGIHEIAHVDSISIGPGLRAEPVLESEEMVDPMELGLPREAVLETQDIGHASGQCESPGLDHPEPDISWNRKGVCVVT
jgi:hypothetical protein